MFTFNKRFVCDIWIAYKTNKKLTPRDCIIQTKKYFKEIGVSADVKYIDPTYMIRAVRANASDGILCTVLGQNAVKVFITKTHVYAASTNIWCNINTLYVSQVHGAFAGYSGITVGIINNHYAYLPIPEVIAYDKSVDPNSRMWHRCLTSTGQPDFI